ncbi:hypothetical protein Tco_0525232 [Tanacetum coccineum]
MPVVCRIMMVCRCKQYSKDDRCIYCMLFSFTVIEVGTVLWVLVVGICRGLDYDRRSVVVDSYQQVFADARSEIRPLMLEKGSYVPWSSRFLRKHEEKDLTNDEKKWVEANIDAMNSILLGISNDIYNSVDACKIAQTMWRRVRR